MEIPTVPEDLKAATDELKPGTGKVLYKVLLYGIYILAAALIFVYKLSNRNTDQRLADCKETVDKKDQEIRQLKREKDSLTNYIIVEAQEDVQWFKQRDAKLDSIVNKYKYLLKNQ